MEILKHLLPKQTEKGDPVITFRLDRDTYLAMALTGSLYF
jgi:hypothetical protein